MVSLGIPPREVLRKAYSERTHFHLQHVHDGDAADGLAVARIYTQHLVARVPVARADRCRQWLDGLLRRLAQLHNRNDTRHQHNLA